MRKTDGLSIETALDVRCSWVGASLPSYPKTKFSLHNDQFFLGY